MTIDPIARKIEQLLKFDPISEAEKITKQRVGDSLQDPTASLGFLLTQNKSQTLQGLLAMQDDISFRSTFGDLIRILGLEGFSVIHQEPTINGDQLIIAWHPEGILVVSESCGGGAFINTAKMYYNLQGNDDSVWRLISTGHMTEDFVIVGEHDIREAFRHKLNKLRSGGRFLSDWVKCPFLWLASYSDTKVEGYDYKSINRKRLSLLPEGIQKSINYQG